jgi:uncharacterized membrane protein
MESKAKLFGHSIHQILIVFPLGLLATAVIFDFLGWRTGEPHWPMAAYYMIAAGLVGGVAAAIFGLIDFIGIPTGTRAKSIGLTHGMGNAIVLLLFLVSFLLRRPDPLTPGFFAHVCSYAGAALAVVTGWMGGELVTRLGIGVDDGANPDAPSSLESEHGPTHDVPSHSQPSL